MHYRRCGLLLRYIVRKLLFLWSSMAAYFQGTWWDHIGSLRAMHDHECSKECMHAHVVTFVDGTTNVDVMTPVFLHLPAQQVLQRDVMVSHAAAIRN